MLLQDLDKIKQNILDKDVEDLTIAEKIKRVSLDDNFTWDHVYELMLIKFMKWWDFVLLKLPNFIIGLLVLFLFILIAKYGGQLLYRILKNKTKQESIREVIVKIFKATIYLFGFLIFLVILDLGIIMTSILGLAGVASLAIGLSIQGVLNNTFSGVIISFLPKLKIGDWVETSGTEGTIHEITLRSVQILRQDNNLVLVPNSQILEQPFINYSLTKRTRVSIECGVTYDSDLKFVRKISINHFKKVFPQINNESVEFYYKEFGDSSINFVIRFWGEALNRKDTLSLTNIAIIELKSLFDQHNITIPFPIRTLEFMNTPKL